MKDKSKFLGSQQIHRGWLSLRQDFFKLENGQTYPYDVVTIGDGVAVLPFLDKDTLLLSVQYRPPIKSKVLELIQGMNRSDLELPIEAAERELLEETGYKGKLSHTVTIYPLPGSLDMRLSIFEATDMNKVQEPENNEYETMELVKIDYKTALNQIISHESIADSALVIALLNHEARKYK